MRFVASRSIVARPAPKLWQRFFWCFDVVGSACFQDPIPTRRRIASEREGASSCERNPSYQVLRILGTGSRIPTKVPLARGARPSPFFCYYHIDFAIILLITQNSRAAKVCQHQDGPNPSQGGNPWPRLTTSLLRFRRKLQREPTIHQWRQSRPLVFCGCISGKPPRAIPLFPNPVDFEDRAEHLGNVLTAVSLYLSASSRTPRRTSPAGWIFITSKPRFPTSCPTSPAPFSNAANDLAGRLA